MLIDRAVADAERGVARNRRPASTRRPGPLLAERVGRRRPPRLNALEVAGAARRRAGAGGVISTADVDEALQRRVVRYDKGGDQHHDVISAFIKSLRGSDPDAAVYWLETMLTAGEDPEFIARRMVILASEDVGLADPAALGVAVAAAQALQFVGLPEAAYALYEAALYLATAPKSNSVETGHGVGPRGGGGHPGGGGAAPPARHRLPRARRAWGTGWATATPTTSPAPRWPSSTFPTPPPGRVLYRPGSAGDEAARAERLAEVDRLVGRPPRE